MRPLYKPRVSLPCWAVSVVALIAMGVSPQALAQGKGQTDPCATMADLQAKDPNVFVGFGSGTTAQSAVEQANLDLARTLRQKVTAETSVEDSFGDAAYTSNTKSTVSEVLVNAKIMRRCQQGEMYSAVATMDKNTFIKALENSLQGKVKQAQTYEKSLQASTGTTAGFDKNLAAAKRFYETTEPSFASDVVLCRTYDGCAKLQDTEALERLGAQIDQNLQQSSYVLVTTEDAVTGIFRQELLSLLEKGGTPVVDGAIDAASSNAVGGTRRILAQCQANRGGEILSGRPDRVFTVQCTVEAYVGSEKIFRKIYGCKTMTTAATDNTAAASACAGRLTENKN